MSGWHIGVIGGSGLYEAAGLITPAGVDPFWHFQNIGWTEGRDPNAWFDTAGYLNANTDVAAAQINPLVHFLQAGHYEGRLAIADGVWGP